MTAPGNNLIAKEMFTHCHIFDSPNIGGVNPRKSQNRQLSLGPLKKNKWVHSRPAVAVGGDFSEYQ